MPRIGLLALQGDFAAHAVALGRAGVDAIEVRRPERLDELDGLVLPGGESTALLNLMRDAPWFCCETQGWSTEAKGAACRSPPPGTAVCSSWHIPAGWVRPPCIAVIPPGRPTRCLRTADRYFSRT